jgi:hypothetical protein
MYSVPILAQVRKFLTQVATSAHHFAPRTSVPGVVDHRPPLAPRGLAIFFLRHLPLRHLCVGMAALTPTPRGDKRRAADEGDTRASIADFQVLLEAQQARMQANFNETIQGLHKIHEARFDLINDKVDVHTEEIRGQSAEILSLKQSVATLVEKFDSLAKSSTDADATIQAVTERVTVIAKGHHAVKERIGLLQEPTYVAPPIVPNWTRAPRQDVLTIGAAEPISKDALKDAVKEWLGTAPLEYPDGYWRIEGPKLGRNFELFFNGEFQSPESAYLKANKANLSLKQEDGTWEKIYAIGPTKKQIELFISKDQTPQVKREFTLSKRLLACIEKSFSGFTFSEKNIYIHRRLMCIKHGNIDLAKIFADSFENFTVKWNQTEVEALGLDKEALLSEFRSKTGLASNRTWTV